MLRDRRLHDLGECFVPWGLARAFDPAALPRQPLAPERREPGKARAIPVRRYGRGTADPLRADWG
jgi:hypothetical protein